jgi:hypothetical protein
MSPSKEDLPTDDECLNLCGGDGFAACVLALTLRSRLGAEPFTTPAGRPYRGPWSVTTYELGLLGAWTRFNAADCDWPSEREVPGRLEQCREVLAAQGVTFRSWKQREASVWTFRYKHVDATEVRREPKEHAVPLENPDRRSTRSRAHTRLGA